jgi:putative transposase
MDGDGDTDQGDGDQNPAQGVEVGHQRLDRGLGLSLNVLQNFHPSRSGSGRTRRASTSQSTALSENSLPGKPTDNGFIEAFNSKLRAECLNAHWFMSLAEAREKLDAWRRDFNEVRPHSAIGYNVPIALHYPDGAASPPS